MEKSVRIWAKLISEGKVAKDIVYTGDMFFDEDSFHAAVRDICDKLDISTPVVLPQHFTNFIRFHNCRFRQNRSICIWEINADCRCCRKYFIYNKPAYDRIRCRR